MDAETSGKQNKAKHIAPATVVKEGTAKRNIIRKPTKTKGGPPGQKGQKGKWKVTDDGTDATAGPLDENDPVYESEEENFVLVASGEDTEYSSRSQNVVYDQDYCAVVIGPQLTLNEFKRRIGTIVEEYFVSEDLGEVLRAVDELQCPEYHFDLVKRSVSMSLDKTDRERELVSTLLSAAYPDILSTHQIAKGFERLMESADDLCLDAPQAKNCLSTFIARAVVDEVIPPAFLTDGFVEGIGGDIVELSKRLLNRDHSAARLERIWGPGDGRPVEELKVAVDQLLKEYYINEQTEEAIECVKEMNAPFFHHEIVKRAVKNGMDLGRGLNDDERNEDDRVRLTIALVNALVREEVVSVQQVVKGMDRLYSIVSDMILDTPNAPKYLASCTKAFVEAGSVPPNYRGANANPPAPEGAAAAAVPPAAPAPATEG